MVSARRALVLTVILVGSIHDASGGNGWDTTRTHDIFYSEGSSAGDIDGDGHVDIVAGPLWFRGPEFHQRGEIAPAKQFPVFRYSDQFFSQVLDVNGDEANDVLVLGFPGKPARLYLNPGHGRLDRHWEMREITGAISNESPAIVDLIPGGMPEIVCARDTHYGYYAAGDDPTRPWQWVVITRPEVRRGTFGHGLGVGDVNGDGRADVLNKNYWWEHPVRGSKSQIWKERRWAPQNSGSGGAQICVDDIDGDGDADIVSSLNAHGYGLAWFEQKSLDRFVQHDIMGDSSIQNPSGVAFSQLHAVAMADIDGDGMKDIVTGKRWMAHNGKDPGGHQQPVLYWFRHTRRDDGIEFVPHLVHDDSGVGVDVLVTDLNDDQRLDIVSASKRGLSIHLQSDAETVTAPERWQVSTGRDQSQYVDGHTPEDAARNMMVAEGFDVDLIASEPDLTQPIAMCFDARGRIWVIEGHTYPQKAPEGQGKDRVLILEDSDADGTFETRKVFMDGLNLASGIEVGFGGVWIGAAPEFLFIPDADRDDVPDADPILLLDGWGYQDTHETLNSFTWGPDGWLYGCHGVFTHSRVGKPGTPDEKRIPINAGVWRYHPTKHIFEVFAHGSSNPWGVDFTEDGDCFITACVIPHLYHVIQGGRYFRQAGSHFNPYTYNDITTIADHIHYGDGTFGSARWDGKVDRDLVKGSPTTTSQVGGGHAHCGLAIYQADVFPELYRGELLFHNLHGHRVVRETLRRDGSGYVGMHRPDFALSQDHQQIGVGIMLGPDGAIYTSDWHDPQTCHNRTPEIWNRTDGRLFRLRYGDVRPYDFDLWNESDQDLVARLQSDNAFFARQAQRILHERAASSELNMQPVLSRLGELMAPKHSRRDRLRALWTNACIGGIGAAAMVALLGDEDPFVRGWAVHLLGESNEPLDISTLAAITERSRNESSAVVRRYLASMLQRLPHEQRWSVIEGLISHSSDQSDRNIPLLVWYGLEPLAEQDPRRAYELVRRSDWLNLFQFTVRRTAVTPEGRDALATRLANPKEKIYHLTILQELLAAATSRGGVEMPKTWPKAKTQFLKGSDSRLQQLTRSVAVQFGDQSVAPYFRAILDDQGKSASQRREALTALKQSADPQLPKQLYPLLEDPDIAKDAAAALASFGDPETPHELLARWSQYDDETKTAALNTLVSRREYAERMVSAMEQNQIAANKVPAFIVRQAVAMDSDELTNRLEQVWGRISSSSEDKKKLYAKYQMVLSGRPFERADASRGRVIYEANCGNCHKLFGVGGDIGPDITGANRSKIDYWLENVLEPNALIGRDYQMTNFLLFDGRVVAGIVKEENDQAITVQTATEKVVIPLDDIEDSLQSKTSLMPEGQMEPLSDQQVRELFKYLMGPTQVPLPGARPAPVRKSAPPVVSKPRRPGTIVFEGEMLTSAKVNAGALRPQVMSRFNGSWSGQRQLCWTGAKPSDKMSFELLPKKSGTYDVCLHLTKAHDYARIRVSADGLETREVDLFDRRVSLADVVKWENVALAAERPLKFEIEITGKNPQGKPRYMVGVDQVELIRREGTQKTETKKTSSRGTGKPNFIVIFCDDMGYADIGPFGAEGYQTPNLNRMAAEGMKFTDFYVGRSFCSPSRAALLTGCIPTRVGVGGNFGPKSDTGLHPNEMIIPEVLKQRGYATACFGKWHLGHRTKFLPTSQGFDEFFGLPYSNDMWPFHPGVRHLPMAKRIERWPHLPLYEGTKVINPQVMPKDQVGLTRRLTERAVKFIGDHSHEPFFVYLPNPQPHVPLFASESFQDTTERGLFGDVITEIDWQVGQILETLKKQGIDEKTCVVFSSDNGPWLSYGDHAGSAKPLREGKGSNFEGGFRVSCLMRWPGQIPADAECGEIASTIDLLPTFAKLADAPLPPNKIDGKDISALMFDRQGAKSPHVVFYHYDGGHRLVAVRSGRWKLMFPQSYNSPIPGSGGLPGKNQTKRIPLSLFDLASDIGETTNVASQYPDVVTKLQNAADEMRKDLGDGKDNVGTGRRLLGAF